MWPRSGEFPKRKSYDNNHPELHPSQFDLYRNASSSWAFTWSRGFFSPYALVSLRTWLLMMARKDGEERWRGGMITSHSTHSTTYTWLLTVYVVGRYFRLWELSVLCPLAKEWGYHFSSITGWRGIWAVG